MSETTPLDEQIDQTEPTVVKDEPVSSGEFKNTIPVPASLIHGDVVNPRDASMPELVNIHPDLPEAAARGYGMLNSTNRILIDRLLSYTLHMKPGARLSNMMIVGHQENLYKNLVAIVSVADEQLPIIMGVALAMFKAFRKGALGEESVTRGIPFIQFDPKDRTAFRSLCSFFVALADEKGRAKMIPQITRNPDFINGMAGIRGVSAPARERLVAWMSSFSH